MIPEFLLLWRVSEEDLSGGHHVEILQLPVPFIGGGNDVVFLRIARSAFGVGAKRRRSKKPESLREAQQVSSSGAKHRIRSAPSLFLLCPQPVHGYFHPPPRQVKAEPRTWIFHLSQYPAQNSN